MTPAPHQLRSISDGASAWAGGFRISIHSHVYREKSAPQPYNGHPTERRRRDLPKTPVHRAPCTACTRTRKRQRFGVALHVPEASRMSVPHCHLERLDVPLGQPRPSLAIPPKSSPKESFTVGRPRLGAAACATEGCAPPTPPRPRACARGGANGNIATDCLITTAPAAAAGPAGAALTCWPPLRSLAEHPEGANIKSQRRGAACNNIRVWGLG